MRVELLLILHLMPPGALRCLDKLTPGVGRLKLNFHQYLTLGQEAVSYQ
jgi:hypothetical protein